MRTNLVWGLVVALLWAAGGRGGDGPEASATLSDLKREARIAAEDLGRARQPGTAEAQQREGVTRYYRTTRELAQRALALVRAHPDAAAAPEALVWVIIGLLDGNSAEAGEAEQDAAYDLLTERYLDRDVILPVCRIAWADLVSPHAEAFLRAAAERSPNLKVRALSCFSLGRYQQQLALLVLHLDDPVRKQRFEDQFGPEKIQWLRKFDRSELNRQAAASFQKTIRDYGTLEPMGKTFPPLGEQAEGALFKLRHLEPGCQAPDLTAADLNGQPLNLADWRGKVVMISFWATWCGPCMGMIPAEKALVERMKGRPFVLLGVNGDDDRAKAQETVAKEGIPWRSFWDEGPHGPISTGWGISGWPTVYLIDPAGVIRNQNLHGAELDRAVEALVTAAEAAKPQ